MNESVLSIVAARVSTIDDLREPRWSRWSGETDKILLAPVIYDPDVVEDGIMSFTAPSELLRFNVTIPLDGRLARLIEAAPSEQLVLEFWSELEDDYAHYAWATEKWSKELVELHGQTFKTYLLARYGFEGLLHGGFQRVAHLPRHEASQ